VALPTKLNRSVDIKNHGNMCICLTSRARDLRSMEHFIEAHSVGVLTFSVYGHVDIPTVLRNGI
jgi:hypothetical protein